VYHEGFSSTLALGINPPGGRCRNTPADQAAPHFVGGSDSGALGQGLGLPPHQNWQGPRLPRRSEAGCRRDALGEKNCRDQRNQRRPALSLIGRRRSDVPGYERRENSRFGVAGPRRTVIGSAAADLASLRGGRYSRGRVLVAIRKKLEAFDRFASPVLKRLQSRPGAHGKCGPSVGILPEQAGSPRAALSPPSSLARYGGIHQIVELGAALGTHQQQPSPRRRGRSGFSFRLAGQHRLVARTSTGALIGAIDVFDRLARPTEPKLGAPARGWRHFGQFGQKTMFPA